MPSVRRQSDVPPPGASDIVPVSSQSLISCGDAMPPLTACDASRADAALLANGTSDSLFPTSGRSRHVHSMRSATAMAPTPAETARLGITGTLAVRTPIPATHANVVHAASSGVACSRHSEQTPSAIVFAATYATSMIAVMRATVTRDGVTCVPMSVPPLAAYSIDCPSAITSSLRANVAMVPPAVMVPIANDRARCLFPSVALAPFPSLILVTALCLFCSVSSGAILARLCVSAILCGFAISRGNRVAFAQQTLSLLWSLASCRRLSASRCRILGTWRHIV